ncbi:TAT-variant-translocated molybdopterin oxidoreductase [Pelagicoccus sp. SDUM812003]|uniref:TAT-variant-translocated molybdopterin oxidoreductase n=1 Tax=Pelagicoccus sp. SDUM812003 TaxID=3041267 RepID=UPI00280D7235|nr:TAT-variant-translocated molybdopterin oxidoreductase [Pelagicoccus sp. SDUM812003]MDQ8202974.1 TAT-variant-translocated molybdopterin oxidoreductase [Pelagicoccus sp. SDUM812003]
MKRAPYTHPETAELSGPRYWRSLDDLSQTPEFLEQVEREFGPEASEMNEVDRRHFFKIMAASFAIGGIGFSGCRRPESHILPYSKMPEHQVPGQALYYATGFPLRGETLPLLVETHTGRPTKIEGNADHPGYRGGTTRKAQAAILDLYDPDRATAHAKGAAKLSNADVYDLLAKLNKDYAANEGQGLAVLTESANSPTRRRLKKAFLRAFPKAQWVEYDAVEVKSGAIAAARLTGNAAALPKYDLSKAERVLSVDADFLDEELGSVQFSKQFADGRRLRSSSDQMNRLYAVESNFSLTGGMADHRKRLASSQMVAFLAALALELELGVEGNALTPVLEPLAAKLDAETKEWIAKCAEDLAAHKGKSLVFPGQHLAPEAHALALLINEKLGNLRQTVSIALVDNGQAASIRDLASSIEEGGVSSLLISGGNPVYNAPADLDFVGLLGKVDQVIRLGYYFDETSEASTYHIAQAHFLEAWGDGETYHGDVVAQQPMILPLFDGLSEIETLARLVGSANADGYSLVYETFQTANGSAGKRGFDKFLNEGFLTRGFRASNANISGVELAGMLRGYQAPAAPTEDSLEVRFLNDASVDDGRYANNGWLQECPDPMTKLTWDNAIIVSPRLAKKLEIVAPDSMIQVARKNPNKVRDGRQFAPVATLKVGGREITGAIHIQPGLDNYTVVLPLGYGRSKTGRVGTGSGFSAYKLRTASAFVSGASMDLTGDTYQLAETQEHWSMEGRAIVREANLDTYAKDSEWVSHMGMESHSPAVYGDAKDESTQKKVTTTPRGGSIYEHPNLTGIHQWGMSIDLNVCSGCNACVIACQSENNIPIVGRDQVRRGREMHWIRLDRYFSSGSSDNTEIPEDPQVSLQPIACMQCETAPCETVCPVNATVHDEEGLNAMAYNRCIGTRYCANNCPYKVRRFNFFDYQQRQLDKLYLGPLAPKGMPELVQMAQNPDVSVRMRGVMEKCTFCVQRINQAKIAQQAKAGDSGDVRVRDGAIKVACEQACPTDAIVFGDLLDTESRVSVQRDNERTYSLLGYLNTRPRTTFMARVRNPNPKMPDYFDQPLSKVEYKKKAYGDKKRPVTGMDESYDAHQGGISNDQGNDGGHH